MIWPFVASPEGAVVVAVLLVALVCYVIWRSVPMSLIRNIGAGLWAELLSFLFLAFIAAMVIALIGLVTAALFML